MRSRLNHDCAFEDSLVFSPVVAAAAAGGENNCVAAVDPLAGFRAPRVGHRHSTSSCAPSGMTSTRRQLQTSSPSKHQDGDAVADAAGCVDDTPDAMTLQ